MGLKYPDAGGFSFCLFIGIVRTMKLLWVVFFVLLPIVLAFDVGGVMVTALFDAVTKKESQCD